MIKYLNIKERHKLKMKDQIKKLENIILKGDEWNAHSSEIDYIKDEIKFHNIYIDADNIYRL